LAIYWAGTLYIHFWGLLRPNGIFPGAKFINLHPSLAFSYIALLHGTRAVGVSQTLRHSAEDATYIQHGSHHVGHPTADILVKNFLG